MTVRPPHCSKPPKPLTIPVRDQLLDLIKDEPMAISTGGQVFVHLDTPGGLNCFTVPLNGPHFRDWLIVRQTAQGRTAPLDNQIRQALRIKQAFCFGGTTRTTRTRMNVRYAWDANHAFPIPQTSEDGQVTYDFLNADTEPAYVLALDTARGRHVAVTSKGWTLHRSQTPFIPGPLQQAQPDPTPTNNPHAALQPFRQLLRLDHPEHDETWTTLLNWTLAAMRAPKDPAFHSYPILNLTGGGASGKDASGKSVAARLLTKLLDPTFTPTHTIPTTERRLHGLAATQHVLTFDDTGKINPEKSRYLSRLAEGVTSLHRDLQGMLVRPIILTTSEQAETKHLANKVVDVELPPIEEPLTPEQINQQFEVMRPEILGALLTLLSNSFDAPTPSLPNRKTKIEKIQQSVINFLSQAGGEWKGTISKLIGHVVQTLACAPSPKAMSLALDEMKGIEVNHPPRKSDQRPIHLKLLVE